MRKEYKTVRFLYQGFIYIGKYIGKKEGKHEIQFPSVNIHGNLCAPRFLITDKEYRKCNAIMRMHDE